jgi:hypothetical protein
MKVIPLVHGWSPDVFDLKGSKASRSIEADTSSRNLRAFEPWRFMRVAECSGFPEIYKIVF